MTLLTATLGDGTPGSSPGATPASGFNWSALPGQILTGAEQWMTPSEAIQTIKDTASGTNPGWGIVAGVALVPIVGIMLLSSMMGRHHR